VCDRSRVLNKRYNPFEVQLEGWSESVMENVDDYDGVFEELYVKYRSKVNVAPEVKLIMMLGGSAMMFHLTNSMFKSVMPNMNDVMKQNPDLVKNMMAAVQNTTRAPGGPATDAPIGGQYEMQGTRGRYFEPHGWYHDATPTTNEYDDERDYS